MNKSVGVFSDAWKAKLCLSRWLFLPYQKHGFVSKIAKESVCSFFCRVGNILLALNR